MKDFKFTCANCGQSISATTEQMGMPFDCPACGTSGVVPKFEDSTSDSGVAEDSPNNKHLRQPHSDAPFFPVPRKLRGLLSKFFEYFQMTVLPLMFLLSRKLMSLLNKILVYLQTKVQPYILSAIRSPRENKRKILVIACVAFSVIGLAVMCFSTRTISTNQTQERNGIVYEINQEKPYTGIVEAFHSNSQKNYRVNYLHGIKNGTSVYWYENGQKKYENDYKNAELDGLSESWYEHGTKKSKCNYENGAAHGLFVYWYKNGQKEYEVHYKDGKRHGLLEKWDENGKKREESNYENGEKTGVSEQKDENVRKESEKISVHQSVYKAYMSGYNGEVSDRDMEIMRYLLKTTGGEKNDYRMYQLIYEGRSDRGANRPVRYKVME